MNNFTRGLEPKDAMDIGWRCKKEWFKDICSTCPHAIFDWKPGQANPFDNTNRNYCELEHWGLHPSKNI